MPKNEDYFQRYDEETGQNVWMVVNPDGEVERLRSPDSDQSPEQLMQAMTAGANARDAQGRLIYGTAGGRLDGGWSSTTIDGVTYRRGTSPQELNSAYGNVAPQGGFTGYYDPDYGWLVPTEQFSGIDAAQTARNNSFAYGPGPGLLTLASMAMPGILGYGTAATSAFPSAASEFGGMAAGELGGMAAGTAGAALPESYWGMLADAGTGAVTDATGAGAAGLADFGSTGLTEFGGPLASEGAGFVPGAFDLGTTAAGGTAASGLGGSGFSLADLLSGKNAVSALGNVAGAGINALAAKSAANTQADAGREANQLLLNMYQQGRADLKPYREAGYGALGNMTRLTTPGQQVSAMEMDPGYQWRLGEGQRTLENSAAARGRLLSGGAIKAGQRYGQNFASNEFGNVFNRNANLAGQGMGAVNTGVNAGQNAAGQMSQGITGIGNVNAAGTVGMANAASGGIQNYLAQLQQDAWIKALMRG